MNERGCRVRLAAPGSRSGAWLAFRAQRRLARLFGPDYAKARELLLLERLSRHITSRVARQSAGDVVVIHAHDVLCASAAIASGGFKRVIATIHSNGSPLEEFRRTGYFSDAPSALVTFQALEENTLLQSAMVTTPSQASAANLLQRYPNLDPNKVRVVPNPVDIPAVEPYEFSRSELGIQDKDVILFTAAHLTNIKRIDLLLEAVRLANAVLARDGLRIVALIAGDGPERRSLQALAQLLDIAGEVRFLGRVSNIGAYYGAADIVGSTSSSESFSLLLAEAAAFGKPLVAFDVGGIGDIVKNEFNGYLVPPMEVSLLADALVGLARNPELRRRFGENSRIRAQNWQMQAIVETWLSIYEEVAR